MSKEKKLPEDFQEVDDIDQTNTPVEEGDSLQTIIVDYYFDLSETDRLEMADRMVELDDQQESQEEQKKAVLQEWNGLIKATEAERRQLAQIYRSGSNQKSIECYAIPDYGSDLMLFVATNDCDFIVKERPLDGSEKQMHLDDIELEEEVPRCHMKEMQFDDEQFLWVCVVCGSTKPLEVDEEEPEPELE